MSTIYVNNEKINVLIKQHIGLDIDKGFVYLMTYGLIIALISLLTTPTSGGDIPEDIIDTSNAKPTNFTLEFI
jgi:hypothetical protein